MRHLAWLAILLVGGCASEFSVERSNPAPQIDSNRTVYVAEPPDGKYADEIGEGSGGMTASAVTAWLSTRFSHVSRGPKTERPDEAKASASTAGAELLFYPEILLWEDRATEWNGHRDRTTLRVTISEVATGRQLDAAVIRGIGTWWTMGGNKPQDLLDRMMQAYGKTLPQSASPSN